MKFRPDRDELVLRRQGAVSRASRAPQAEPPPPLRTFLRPRWLALHAAFLAVMIACVLLGRWQLSVSNRRHFDLQNFGYTMQYWSFSVFTLFLWIRTIRDRRRGSRPAAEEPKPEQVGSALLVSERSDGTPIVYRGYVPPTTAQTLVPSHGDSYHDAYNDYLFQLNQKQNKSEDSDVSSHAALERGRRSIDGNALDGA